MLPQEIPMAKFRGKPACACLIAWLPVYERELLDLGVIKHSIDIYQLIGGARSSAGTHSTGGAFDIAQTQGLAIKIARQMGADATWHRKRSQGFSVDHTHGVLRGCPHNRPARYQVAAVNAGYNGLGRNGRGGKDDGPRPLSGRTWEQGIAWAKARQKARHKPALGDRWVKVLTQNAACDNAVGKRNWAKGDPTRRERLIENLVDASADVWFMQELPRRYRDWVDAILKRAGGGYRRIAGNYGRYIYARASIPVHRTGVMKPGYMLPGQPKRVTWAHVSIDGSGALLVNCHAQYGAANSKLRARWSRRVMERVEALRVELGLSRSQVIIGGDFNGREVLAAAADYGYVEAIANAHRAVGGPYATYTGWARQSTGPRIDMILVHSTRPVSVWNQHLDNRASDHNQVRAILYRKA